MKRVGKLHEKICTLDNIELADRYARRNKKDSGIAVHDTKAEEENLMLLDKLQNLTYKTSNYTKFKIKEKKERIIFKLPYYPDRITHWAIMLIMEDIWVNTFIKHTYSCVKGRGIHKAIIDIQKALSKDSKHSTYCLKMDVKKFYPSIKHDILERLLRRKIKDKKLLSILDEIVESAEGVPIGNYLSQFFANLYLTYYDHWMKEVIGVKHYFRYTDDIMVLSEDKNFLEKVVILTKLYFKYELNISIKDTYFITEITDTQGVTFLGYRFFRNYTLIGKDIKRAIEKVMHKYKQGKIGKDKLKRTMSSYFGWLKWCNSKNYLQKIEDITGLHFSNWKGKKINISTLKDKCIYIVEKVDYSKYFQLHFIYKGKPYIVNSRNVKLKEILEGKQLPINFKL